MMALNIKTESRVQESSSVVNLSSDDDDCVIENKNIDPEPKPPERTRTPDTHCSICLDELINKCYSEACWHMFCFECLKRWSTISSSCPLCKKEFKTIFHTFNDQGLHETYVVPLAERQFPPRIYIRPFAELSEFDNRRIFSLDFFMDLMRRNDRLINNLNDLNDNVVIRDQLRNSTSDVYDIQDNRGVHPHNYRRPISIGHLGRVQVYSSNVWAEPLPDLSGRYRDCSLDFYRQNPSQTHRLHGFILRDVIAVRSIYFFENGFRLEARITNYDITNIIMAAILEHDIRSTYMSTYLRPYLGIHTDHFCHELHNFANSPYDLIGYDRNVRYSSLASHSMAHVRVQQNVTDQLDLVPNPVVTVPNSQHETIVLDTDSDDIVETNREIIVVSSADDDSEIEILEHHIHPTFDLSYRDQPSTSTGIRDSLDLSNTRYNFRRRRLIRPPTNSSGNFVQIPRFTRQSNLRIREEPTNYISSSNDDEPTTIASMPDPSQAMHVETGIVCDKRKKKCKKRKKNKKKTDGSELRFSSTHQTFTDWSSSDESDIRPQNHHTSICVNMSPRTQ